MKKRIIIVTVILVIGVVAYVYRSAIMAQFFKPNDTTTAVEMTGTSTVVASNLNIPWEIAFLPDGDMLVTERPGNLLRINKNSKEAIKINGVEHKGEGGLLGLALDPNFKENNYIYLYLTTISGKSLTNQVERYTLNGTSISNRTVILKDIPGSSNHDGGRIAFGPDNLLYITTGDAGDEDAAQNTASLAGKILRIKEDGNVEMYSYGHRNIQGITWDSEGQLWATEHGRSGAKTGFDELNKIIQGGNYGWPITEGDANKEGMINPQIHSGSSETWAPAGILYLNNKLIFTGLRGEALYVTDISNGTVKDLKKYVSKEYGRLRSVAVGPDNLIYILTNNRDGRGSAKLGDDKVIKLDPSILGL